MINVLLEYGAGIGYCMLLSELTENEILLSVNAFSFVNVIGSGITKDCLGFESAICDIDDFLIYLDQIKGQSTVNPAMVDNGFELLLERCQKRLNQFDPLDFSENRQALVQLIKKLDLLMSGNLKRQCLRFIASNFENMDKKIEWEQLGEDLNSVITNEVRAYNIFKMRKEFMFFLNHMEDFLKRVENNPKLDTIKEDYLKARATRFISFGLSFFLLSIGCGSYFIPDGIARWQEENKMVLPNDTISEVFRHQSSMLEIGMPVIFILSSFLLLISASCVNHASQDIVSSNFTLYLYKLKEAVIREKTQIVGNAKIFSQQKMISDDLVANFDNANNLRDLVSAMGEIIAEGKNHMRTNPIPPNIFYNKSTFFCSAVEQSSLSKVKEDQERVVIELSDEDPDTTREDVPLLRGV